MKREEVEETLKLLYAGADSREKLQVYYREKKQLLLKVLLAGSVMLVLLLLSLWYQPTLREGRFLARKNAPYVAELTISTAGGQTKKREVRVEPRKLTAQEGRELLAQVKERMEEYILGENTSLEEVRSDLRLLTSLEAGQVQADWELDSYEVLNLDGSIRAEGADSEGQLVELTAVLTCAGETEIYRGCARVLPPLLSQEEEFWQAVSEEEARLEAETGTAGQKELPTSVQGTALVWKEKRLGTVLAAAGLLVLTLGLIWAAKDRELKEKVRSRELQMRRDYAQIVSKLVLLMGAGATIRSAWEILVRDYQTKREKGGQELRYAYEEMALAAKEMQNGVAEARAYENFGMRCRVPCYLRLSALLEQNLKKGSRGLTQLLELEVQEAFEQRKELARSRGEEAATRMLLPMILLLVLVMLIVMVPAGMSMRF